MEMGSGILGVMLIGQGWGEDVATGYRGDR